MFVARTLFFGVCFLHSFCLPVSLATEGESSRVEAPGALERIEKLRAEIAYHDDLYYRLASPVISDAQYDALKRRLAELEKANPSLVSVSTLGDDRIAGFAKAEHAVPMLSLEKVYSKNGLSAFDEKNRTSLDVDSVEYLVEPKFDGIAISVLYESGRLTRAVTRGNGRSGDDVTANIKMISGIPSRLGGDNVPARIELRGEIFLTFDAFQKINVEREALGEDPYRSIRNLAAGSVKLKDSREVAARGLSVIFFGYGSYEPVVAAPFSQAAFYSDAREWGLPVVEGGETVVGFGELELAIARIEADRVAYPFPTDGAVVKVNRLVEQEKLGSTDYAPRWALAYKFTAERVATRVVAITPQIGRTGLVTPVAELEPVNLGGSRISRATLHHFGNIENRDIRIGDTVILEKAGEIVPAVLGVDLAKRKNESVPYVAPVVCPSCHALLSAERDGAILYCLNSQCSAQRQRSLEHFASAYGVNIRGMGPARIAAWIESGELATIADFYRIEELGTVADSIESSKRAELWRILSGLGIRGIGEKRSRQLADVFGGLPAILAMEPEDFEKGGKAQSLSFGALALRHFSLQENRRVVEELMELGVGLEPAGSKSIGTGLLVGKVFVLTGRFEHFSQSEATHLIESEGGVVRGSVTGKTDYLVIGANAGSKLAAARPSAVAVLNEAELLDLLGR